MMDDEFLAIMQGDPQLALIRIVGECDKIIKEMSADEVPEKALIRLLALAITVFKRNSIKISFGPPIMKPNAADNVAIVREYLIRLRDHVSQIDAQTLLQTSISAYERELDVGFCYEFSDGEIERLQALINELREAIREAEYFDEDHRGRLLGRLEKLQAELHKRVSDLDAFLGVMVQIGAATRRFGEDAKPLVDRVREIIEIVAGVFRRAEKLPPGPEFPLLPTDE